MEEKKEYISVKEYADALGIHPNTVRRAIKEGKIAAIRTGIGSRSHFRILRPESGKININEFVNWMSRFVK